MAMAPFSSEFTKLILYIIYCIRVSVAYEGIFASNANELLEKNNVY